MILPWCKMFCRDSHGPPYVSLRFKESSFISKNQVYVSKNQVCVSKNQVCVSKNQVYVSKNQVLFQRIKLS